MPANLFEAWRPQRELAMPVYLQIESWIEGLILNQAIAPHTPLPSVPVLCQQCDVSALTVHKAYRRLKERGLVYAIVGSGTFVAPVDHNHFVGLLIHRETLAAAAFSPTVLLHLESLHEALVSAGYTDRIIVDNNPRQYGHRAPISADAMAVLEQPSLQGLIAITHDGSDDLAALIRRRRLPSVGIGVEERMYSVAFEVRQDHFIAEALQALHGYGLVDVAVMYFDLAEKLAEHRVGYLNRIESLFRKASIPMRPEWIVGVSAIDVSGGYDAFEYLWNQPKRPRGLVIVDDVVARSAMTAIAAHHVRLPNDLHVCVVGNGRSPLVFPPTWSRWEFDTDGFCSQVVEQIRTLEAGGRVPKVIPVKPRLIAEAHDHQAEAVGGATAGFHTGKDILLQVRA